MQRMPHRPIQFLACGLALLLAFGLAVLANPSPAFRLVIGDLVPLLLLTLIGLLCVQNAAGSGGHIRLFWSLMSGGMAMWWFNQAAWTWQEAVVHKPLPDPFIGDLILFLHVAPIMGAVAIRPHQADERDGLAISGLNALVLCGWWMVVYAFFIFPEEYLATDIPVYTRRWDLLYLAAGLMLAGVCLSACLSSSGQNGSVQGDVEGGGVARVTSPLTGGIPHRVRRSEVMIWCASSECQGRRFGRYRVDSPLHAGSRRGR